MYVFVYVYVHAYAHVHVEIYVCVRVYAHVCLLSTNGHTMPVTNKQCDFMQWRTDWGLLRIRVAFEASQRREVLHVYIYIHTHICIHVYVYAYLLFSVSFNPKRCKESNCYASIQNRHVHKKKLMRM